jgi:hypothetical protein
LVRAGPDLREAARPDPVIPSEKNKKYCSSCGGDDENQKRNDDGGRYCDGVSEEKYGDSIAKLEDIMVKVNALLDAAKPKLNETAGDDILYLTEIAYNCLLDVQMERLKQP